MKLKFGILWLEDNATTTQTNRIASMTKNAGFDADIRISKDGGNLKKYINEQNLYHSFDLILIDLNLDKNISGDKLALKIRKNFPFTPILFYSALESATELRNRIHRLGVDGVYCANKNGFLPKVKKLIEDYSHSLNRLSGMRGLAVQVVSEIDDCFRQIIDQLAINSDTEKSIKFIKEQIIDQSESNIKKINKLNDLSEIIDEPMTDSSKLFRLYRHMLKNHEFDNQQIADEVSLRNIRIKDYQNQILKIRNTLSHAQEIRFEDRWEIHDKKGNKVLEISDIPKIRENFLNYLTNIEEIRNLIVYGNIKK